jgi:protein-L-isoaspartate(D-aspartate) O-methyltransferase
VSGWVIPPPSRPVKSDEDLRREREARVAELGRRGLLRSERLGRAMLTVRREDFIPPRYRDHAYEEVPLPLPGERAAISCPHSYPRFYEPLGLSEGDRFLEVGVGSGYGTSLAREVVGPEGLVVAIDIDATTLAFARENLERAGYTDIVLVDGDGGLGYPAHAPLRRDLHHRGVPRRSAAVDRAAHGARAADRARPRRHAPAPHPPGEDDRRHPAHDPHRRVVRSAAGPVRRQKRRARLSRHTKRCRALAEQTARDLLRVLARVAATVR